MDQEETDHHDSELLAPESHQEVGEQANAPALADEVLPDTLVLLPLPGRPFFPVSYTHLTLPTNREV